MKQLGPAIPYVNLRLPSLTKSNKQTLKKLKIQIFVQENVSEFTKVHSYSPSDYMVEIGSSLGLWLGLSVISFFDILILSNRFVKKSVEQLLGHNKDK